MFAWLSQYSEVLKVFTGVGTIVLWSYFSAVLYARFRRYRTPRLLINKGIGKLDFDSPCLVCNMGEQAVFLQSIIAEVRTSEGSYSGAATNSEETGTDSSANNTAAPVYRSRQGPLDSGHCIDVGSFRYLAERAARVGGLTASGSLLYDVDVTISFLRLTAIAIYGPDSRPFYAERTFTVSRNKENILQIKPKTLDAKRVAGWKGKARAKRWLWKDI